MLFDTFTLFSNVNTGTSTAYPANGYDRIAINIRWAPSTSQGTLVLESSPTSDYTGTWNSVKTYNFINDAAGAAAGDSFDIGGDQFYRARFSADTDKNPTVSLTRSKIGLF